MNTTKNRTTKIKFVGFAPLQKDGAGGFVPQQPGTTILETWAQQRQVKATKTAEALQEQINPVYELKIRKRANFNPQSDYTVEMNSKEYAISTIEENDKEWIITIVGRGTGL